MSSWRQKKLAAFRFRRQPEVQCSALLTRPLDGVRGNHLKGFPRSLFLWERKPISFSEGELETPPSAAYFSPINP